MYNRARQFALRSGLNLPSALGFMFSQARFRRNLIWGGLLMLLLPPVGWIVALGYRSKLLNLLIDGRDTTELKLPESSVGCFLIGLKAVGVIYSYYLPFLILFFALGITDAYEIRLYYKEVIIFFAIIPLFLPVCMIGVPAYYLSTYHWIHLSIYDYAVLVLVFALTTFLMPAAFMQVGLHGSYLAAYRFPSVLAGIHRGVRTYITAWVLSGALLTSTVVFFPIYCSRFKLRH